MPDLMPLVYVTGFAFAAGGLVFLLCTTMLRKAPVACWPIAGAVSVGAGFLAGCRLLTGRPRFSLAEDQDRFLVLVIPLAVVTEALAGVLSERGVWRWLVRLPAVVLVLPILLWGTQFVADIAGPDSRLWSVNETRLHYLLLPTLLLTWPFLERATREPGGFLLPAVMALVCAAAGVAIMGSGYFSGGQLGPVLAGALLGGFAGMLVTRSTDDTKAMVGVGLIGLCALLLMGRYFGSLPTGSALLIWIAPLGMAVPGRLLRPGLAWLRIGVVLLFVAAGLGWSMWPSGESGPSMEDYQGFEQ